MWPRGCRSWFASPDLYLQCALHLESLHPRKAGWILPGLFICLPGGAVNNWRCCWMSTWIAISVWCYRCQLYQKCVNRSPPHGSNSSLVTPWATFSLLIHSWPLFFCFGSDKRADGKSSFVQQHPHAGSWLLGPTVKGMERNNTAAGRWGFEAWGDCCPGWIEILKSNFFSGTSYFQITLRLYCCVLTTYANIE